MGIFREPFDIVARRSFVRPFDNYEKGLIAEWQFDEGTGEIIHDTSGTPQNFNLSYNGDISGTPPQWVSTPHGNGMQFVADENREYNGKLTPLTDKLTFEIWIKVIDNGERMGIYQSMNYGSRGFRVGIEGGLIFAFSLDGGDTGIPETTVRSVTPLVDSEWTHVACTYENPTAKIYINNVFDVEKDVPNVDIGGGTVSLGYTGGTPFFNGVIDAIKIYDIVKTEFNINDPYNPLPL